MKDVAKTRQRMGGWWNKAVAQTPLHTFFCMTFTKHKTTLQKYFQLYHTKTSDNCKLDLFSVKWHDYDEITLTRGPPKASTTVPFNNRITTFIKFYFMVFASRNIRPYNFACQCSSAWLGRYLHWSLLVCSCTLSCSLRKLQCLQLSSYVFMS